MRPEEFKQLLRRQPFIPIRVHVSGGKTYDIYHPDNIIVLQSRIDIGVGGDPSTGVVGAVEYVSLLHLVRVEDLPSASPPVVV